MSAHTSGPWMVVGIDIRPAEEYVGRYEDGSAPAIATVWGRYSPAEPGHIKAGSFDANARLIAAAPALLEALKRLLFGMPEFPHPETPQDAAADPQKVRVIVRDIGAARAAISLAEGK